MEPERYKYLKRKLDAGSEDILVEMSGKELISIIECSERKIIHLEELLDKAVDLAEALHEYIVAQHKITHLNLLLPEQLEKFGELSALAEKAIRAREEYEKLI